MPKILSIDYGTVRTGLAISDDTKTFAFGLETVKTQEIIPSLTTLTEKEEIELFLIGEPKQMDGTASESEVYIQKFITELENKFPSISVHRHDERFTSKLAFNAMIDMGMKKKQRRNKGKIDEISAVIILQSYLDSI